MDNKCFRKGPGNSISWSHEGFTADSHAAQQSFFAEPQLAHLQNEQIDDFIKILPDLSF